MAAELQDPKQRDASVTQAAAMALGMLCEPEEIQKKDGRYADALRKAFEVSLDHQTRFFCLMALGRIGGERNRTWLLERLATGSRALVKPWAGLALGTLAHELSSDNATAAVRGSIGQALLREFRDVKNDETRACLALALGLCGHAAGADDLRAMLGEEQHRDELAGYLCIGLAMMRAREAIGDIRRIVVTSVRRPERLRQAAIALGKLGDKGASELLLDLLADDNRNLAKLSATAVALGLIGDRRSIDPLVKLLLDESEPGLSRAFAAVALGGVADKDDLPWGTDLAVGVNYRAAVETLTDGIAGVLDIL
jgi:HEAT repeat protein